MADDGFDGLPYRDTLKPPSVLVFPGDPWPADFYARYPDAFRVPVRIVWRNEASAGNGAAPPSRTVMASSDATSGGAKGERATRMVRNMPHGVAVPAPVAAHDPGRGDPVSTFLRVNKTLNQLSGTVSPEARPAGVEFAAAGDLRCVGFSGGCQNGGNWGSTAGYINSGKILCAACAEKFLGIAEEPGAERNKIPEPFILPGGK